MAHTPGDMQPQAASGIGNMGDVTDVGSVARFSLPGTERYNLAVIRGTFTGGSGTADCVIKLDNSKLSGLFDHTLFTIKGVGSTKPLHFRVSDDELDRWEFGGDDVIVLEWTNPDPGNMVWAVEVGLIDAANRG